MRAAVLARQMTGRGVSRIPTIDRRPAPAVDRKVARVAIRGGTCAPRVVGPVASLTDTRLRNTILARGP